MIFINARFLTQSITGVQRYALEISRILKKIDPSIRFVAPKNIKHPELAKELGVEVIGRLTGHLWEQIELPRFLKSNGSPLLLSLATTAPVFYARKIVTVHDLAFMHFPDAVSWKFRLYYNFLIPRVLRSSLHVTTVSNFSKNDICSTYRIKPGHLTVVYNASSSIFHAENAALAKEKAIIAVGSIQPYKNIETLVKAFDLFKQRGGSDYVLKLIGGWNKSVFKATALAQMLEGRSDVQLTGYVADADLFKMYGSATCYVFPSRFEGFGIPPLEAMACACPVIASTAASIPEVCLDAALYFDPDSADDMAEKMLQLVNDKALQEELVKKGTENIKRFSWEKSGQAMFEIIKKYQ
ncbi:glycosyltransferase family 4 protein [Janthinobacterium lividum]|uniref:glycosyltransferase family 4 protein n=1 Tax=Janthinobacterium lividum TaxID=29581 RepID=UPI000447DAD1|nr:glycosyltransferase family 1 protein [Janthinobacterium lividum]EZP41374.1 Glycosyltransferase [Janthinobacterium lividum]